MIPFKFNEAEEKSMAERESEPSLRFPRVFIIQNGRRPRAQEERVEGDSTERLRASKEEEITALPFMHYSSKHPQTDKDPFTWSFGDVLVLLSY